VVERVPLVASGAEVTAWTKRVDGEMARSLARQDLPAAGMALAEYCLPSRRRAWLCLPVGRLAGRLRTPMFASPAADLLTELRSEETFDSQSVLPQVRVPVLLIAGILDRCFSTEAATETAGLSPDCTLIWYCGKGHSGTVASSRVARDVLAFAVQRVR